MDVSFGELFRDARASLDLAFLVFLFISGFVCVLVFVLVFVFFVLFLYSDFTPVSNVLLLVCCFASAAVPCRLVLP